MGAELLLTAEEAAERIRVSTKTLRALRQRGLIRYVAVTERKIFYRPQDCEDFIEDRIKRDEPAAKPPVRTGRSSGSSGKVVPIRPFSARMGESR